MAITDLIPWKRKESGNKEEARDIAVRQDPFLSFQRQMNQMFGEFSRGWGLVPFGSTGEEFDLFSPRVDVIESDEQVKVSVELPGMEEEDIDVSLSRGLLNIRGEKKRETEEKGRDYYRAERSYGSFRRSVALPSSVDGDKAEALFHNGVLTVTLPKKSTPQAGRRVTVEEG